MKQIIYTVLILIGLIAATNVYGQEETSTEKKQKDTLKFNFKKMEILMINKESASLDTIDASPEKDDNSEPHWAGIDFGVTNLMNSDMKSSFPIEPMWENDPAKSFYWNLNFMDHKFHIYKHYVGLTTGFGVNFTQIGIKNNHILMENSDSLWFMKDTVNNYSKNKLRALYLQVPLLLEFNTNEKENETFYFSVGLIGGVRVGSATIQKIRNDNFKNKHKTKGTYGLNPFKLDATIRMGYTDYGLFLNYALIALFDTNKTVEAYPFTFGVTMNF